jgi:hypothetical protein
MIVPKPAGEQIKAPKDGEPIKKMPEGAKPEAKPEAKPTDKDARAPAILEVTPTTKVAETGTRNPF